MRIGAATTVLAFVLGFVGCTGGPDAPGGGSSGTTSSSGGSSSSTSSGGSSGSATPLDPSDYATDCTQASDCVAVEIGSDPCCGGCTTNAIATKDKSRYDADNLQFRASCNSESDRACPPIRCAQGTVACTNSRCTLAN